MPLKAGDGVRIENGLNGIIVSLASDLTAFVRIIGDASGSHAVLYRLDTLTRFKELELGK
jgi:hypothetical protein